MKSAKVATLVSTLVVILMLGNHALMARLQRAAVANGQVGVNLPQQVVILIKLDHFFEDYFYVLVPVFWLATVLVVVAVRALFSVPSKVGPTDG